MGAGANIAAWRILATPCPGAPCLTPTLVPLWLRTPCGSSGVPATPSLRCAGAQRVRAEATRANVEPTIAFLPTLSTAPLPLRIIIASSNTLLCSCGCAFAEPCVRCSVSRCGNTQCTMRIFSREQSVDDSTILEPCIVHFIRLE